MTTATDTTPGPQAQAANSFAMIRTLSGIALVSGVLLALVYQATFDIIKANKEEAVKNAVFAVLPGLSEAHPPVAFGLNPDTGELVELASDGDVLAEGFEKIYVGFDDAGQFVGVALPASGQGYGDVIRVMYGYTPAAEQITGLKILESKETPGLGDRIGKEPFLDNFRGMDVKMDDARESLLHAIQWVKHGEKTEPWQVDGISGATISSTAIARMLRESTQRLLPAVNAKLDELKDAG